MSVKGDLDQFGQNFADDILSAFSSMKIIIFYISLKVVPELVTLYIFNEISFG